MANTNPVVTITMENGDVMKSRTVSGNCTEYSK